MKIYIGADHAGYSLKEVLIPLFIEKGHEVVDLGAFQYDAQDDYPDFIIPVANKVSHSFEECRGVIIGASGHGEAIVANRFPRVRCMVFNGQYNPGDDRDIPDEITLSREHNDSNVISLGARFINEDEAKHAVEKWLETPFSDEERHKRRLQKIEEINE